MTRILEVLVSTRTGGGPRHVLDLARSLRARGFEPLVAGPRDGPVFDAFGRAGIEAVELGTDGLAPGTLARLVRMLRERRIRLVHSHGKGAGVHGRVAARLCGIPSVHTFHGIHFEGYPAPARAFYLVLERGLSRWTSAIVNVSLAEQAEGLARRLFSRAQSHVIPNGVDVAGLVARALDRDAARRALGLAAGAFVVGCVARLDPVKGVDRLLRAVAACDASPELVLIGDGAEAAALRRLAVALGLEGRVRFLGEVPEAARLYRAFDVYASAAHKEGMPLAVIEAMALGLPIVASDIPAHREVLGTDAPLAEASAAPFGAALGRLGASPETRRQLGEGNRARSIRFDLARMADAIAGLYGRLLGP